jgi:hypothetical protein
MRRPTDQAQSNVQYWERRLRSAGFKRALTAVVQRELTALAHQRVKDVVDAELVGSMIREWDTRMIDRARLADLVVEGTRQAVHKRRPKRGRRLLDAELVADIDALVREGFVLSADAEDAIAAIMRQDFVRGLFTDIIFSAIVSFYQRVNPLFGAMTMRVLEEQIKGFIRFFMPMLQRQATAFIVNQANQRVAADFVSAVLRQLLEQPLPRYAETMTTEQRRKLEALIRDAMANAELEAVVRQATLAAWDDVYALIKEKRVGDLVRLEEQTGWFAERCIEFIVPALLRPHILEFLAVEMTAAARMTGVGTSGRAPR